MSARRCTHRHGRTLVHPTGPRGSACRHAGGESLLHEALLNPVLGENLEDEQHELQGELWNPVLGESHEDVQDNSPLSSAMQSGKCQSLTCLPSPPETVLQNAPRPLQQTSPPLSSATFSAASENVVEPCPGGENPEDFHHHGHA